MVKDFRIATVLVAIALFEAPAFAQRSAGCMNRGGEAAANRTANRALGTGGGFMANAQMLQQLAVMNRTAPNGFSTSSNASRPNRPRNPEPEQFVQAALRFDGNQDRQLDETEIARVAQAIVTEMQQRQRIMGSSMRNVGFSQRPSGETINNIGPPQNAPTPKQMADVFVKRAMTFDTDDSDSLNRAEIRRLAAAFVLTL